MSNSGEILIFDSGFFVSSSVLGHLLSVLRGLHRGVLFQVAVVAVHDDPEVD